MVFSKNLPYSFLSKKKHYTLKGTKEGNIFTNDIVCRRSFIVLNSQKCVLGQFKPTAEPWWTGGGTL